MKDLVKALRRENQRLESQLRDHKNILESLGQSEAKYRRMVEGLEDDYLLFTHDMEGKYLYVSPSAKNILGVEPEALLHKGWDELFELPEESLRAGLRSDQLCSEGKMPKSFEYTVILKDGREVIFEVKERPVFDEDGNVVANEGIAKNITREKKIERELRKALAEIKTLQGIIPICSGCKKIRDEKGAWRQVEEYISRHSNALFSHGICPECTKKLYPDLDLDPRLFDAPPTRRQHQVSTY